MEIKEKLDALIKDWGAGYWEYVVKTGIPHQENEVEFREEVLSLLQDAAKDAYHAGFINKTPDANFIGCWQQLSLNDK